MDVDLRRWAVKGAEQRLVEIAGERARIYAQFPELRDREVAILAARKGPGRPKGTATVTQPRRKRRRMSKEARKRISEAQKARWARQRAEKRR